MITIVIIIILIIIVRLMLPIITTKPGIFKESIITNPTRGNTSVAAERDRTATQATHCSSTGQCRTAAAPRETRRV